jgi:hypothetical protein
VFRRRSEELTVTHGNTSLKSVDRQNDGSVEVCATIEQMMTSDTAIEGGST